MRRINETQLRYIHSLRTRSPPVSWRKIGRLLKRHHQSLHRAYHRWLELGESHVLQDGKTPGRRERLREFLCRFLRG